MQKYMPGFGFSDPKQLETAPTLAKSSSDDWIWAAKAAYAKAGAAKAAYAKAGNAEAGFGLFGAAK